MKAKVIDRFGAAAQKDDDDVMTYKLIQIRTEKKCRGVGRGNGIKPFWQKENQFECKK